MFYINCVASAFNLEVSRFNLFLPAVFYIDRFAFFRLYALGVRCLLSVYAFLNDWCKL